MPLRRPRQSAALRVSTLLPAEKASAEAALAEAQVDLDKTFVRAGVDGRVEQFLVRAGDVVNPADAAGRHADPGEAPAGTRLQAGFGQIEAQVMKPGMVAEATCISKPWKIIPMVVTNVQDYIAAGQFRGRRTAGRCAERCKAGHDSRLPGAALQGRSRRRDAGQ